MGGNWRRGAAMSSQQSAQRAARPMRRFVEAAGACADQSVAYGNCVLSQYRTISQGACEREFAAFRQCVQSRLGRKW